jgi:muscleblind protein
MNPSLAANPAMAFNPYMTHPGMGLVPAELLPNGPVLISGNPPLALPGVPGPKPIRTDRLEVFVKTYINACKLNVKVDA